MPEGESGDKKVPSMKDFASKRKRAAQRDRPLVDKKKFMLWGAVVAVVIALVVLLFLL